MARLLALLLVLTGPVLLVPPASAAVSVTLEADRSAVMAGETVSFSGRAAGARRGSTVHLHRRVGDRWKLVASSTTGVRRGYRFRVTPPKGLQVYRVVKPRQYGEPAATSPSSRVTVRWRPRISGATTTFLDDGGSAVTRLQGTAEGLAGTTLVVQELVDGSWTATGERTRVRADDRYAHDFADAHVVERYRLFAPASGPRLPASSPQVATAWTPIVRSSSYGRMREDDVWLTCQRGEAADLAGQFLLVERFGDGAWRQLSQTPVDAAGGYDVCFDPAPVGTQYRLVAPASGRRLAVSAPAVTVEDEAWRPVISGEVTTYTDAEGRAVTRFAGTAPAFVGGELHVERFVDGAWTSTAQRVPVQLDGSFSHAFPDAHTSETYRLYVPADGPRLSGSSPEIRTAWTPVISTLVDGEMREGEVWVTCIRGEAPALVGQVLHVERYDAGTWTEAPPGPLTLSSQEFGFCLEPEPVNAEYRLRAAADGLRLETTSESVITLPAWRPVIESVQIDPVHEAVESDYGPAQEQSLRVTGMTDAPGVRVVLTRVDPVHDGGYLRLGSGITDANGAFDFAAQAAPEGEPLTVRIPENGRMLGTEHPTIPAPLAPWGLPLEGEPLRLYGIPDGVGARLELDVAANQYLSLWTRDLYRFDADGISHQLLDPTGTPVAEDYLESGLLNTRSYTSREAGRYTLVLTSDTGATDGGEVEIWGSTPLQVQGGSDVYAAVRVPSLGRPRQAADVSYTGTAGQVVRLPNVGGRLWNCGEDDARRIHLVQGGQVVPRREAASPYVQRRDTIWELPADGPFTMRVEPCVDEPFGTIASATLDGFALDLDEPWYGAFESQRGELVIQPGTANWGVVSVEAAAGDTIALTSTATHLLGPDVSHFVLAPDGSYVGEAPLSEGASTELVAPRTGTYRLWIGPFSSDSASVHMSARVSRN